MLFLLTDEARIFENNYNYIILLDINIVTFLQVDLLVF